jgi:hypothetical protein
MTKHFLFFICFSIFITMLNCLFTPLTELTNIPTCKSFSGNTGMTYANGHTYLVYRTQTNNEQQIILAKSTSPGEFDNSIVTSYPIPVSYDIELPTAPTLWIESQHIIIMFSRESRIYKAESFNDGQDFQIVMVESAFDSEPIYSVHNEMSETFIANQDKYKQLGYQHFSQIGRSVYDEILDFVGTDVIYGPVRSNSDISVAQIGGGINNGWPTFWGDVFTTGTFQSMSGAIPYSTVFRGNYYEHVDSLKYDTVALNYQLTQNGLDVLGNLGGSNKICFMTVTGNSFSTMIGTIVTTDIDTFWVYATYPPPSGDHLYANYVTHVDTLWVNGPSGTNLSQQNLYIDAPLWIRGIFSGKWTIYTPYSIWLNGDILLTNTPLGESPDGTISPFHINHDDVVNLVTGKQIMIQYGYKNPIDSLRYYPNCGSDADGIWIYAKLYALNKSTDNNPLNDGMFALEYQCPHPSTPDRNISNVIYDHIDLHLYGYPTTLMNPWTPNRDYPWYNPLWPEAAPYMERGTIHFYGSNYQYRRGFVHRSLNDPNEHDQNGTWDLANHLYGGMSMGLNFPGASGAGVGYKKSYHYDFRSDPYFNNYSPFGFGLRLKTSSNDTNWELQKYMNLAEIYTSKSYDQYGDYRLYQLNRHIFYTIGNNYNLNEIQTAEPADWNIKSAVLTSESKILACWHSADYDSLKLVLYDPQEGTEQDVLSIPLTTRTFALADDWMHNPLFVNLTQEGIFDFYNRYDSDNLLLIHEWAPGFSPSDLSSIMNHETKISLKRAEPDSIFICLWNDYVENNVAHNMFRFTEGYILPGANHDQTAEPLFMNSNCYPNPFSNALNISLETNKEAPASISIYNIRGQCVKTMPAASLKKGTNKLVWNGLNNSGKPESLGIYFVKVKIGEKVKIHKILMMK